LTLTVSGTSSKTPFVVRVESGTYEVTVVGLAPMWLATPGLFDGMLLRLDGREAGAIVDAKRESDSLVLHAYVDGSSVSPER